MMVPLSMAISDQIRFLLQGLNASNSDSVAQELREFAQYGDRGCILLLKTCLEHGDIYDTDLKNVQLEPAVSSLFKDLLVMPNFGTLFCQCVRSESISEEVLKNISVAFCLNISEQIALGLALSDSESQDVRNCGKSFCMFLIEGLLASPSALVSTEIIKQILTFLCRCEDLSKHLDTFTRMLHLVPSEEHTPSTLAPFVPDHCDETRFMRNVDFLCDSIENDFDAVLAEMEKEKNIADLVTEMGHSCTVDAESCKSILSHLSPLTDLTISRIISTVACTHARTMDHQNAVSLFLSATGYNPASEPPLLSSWNINILVESIKELAPATNWRSVMDNLDHEGFYIFDEAGFTCLMSIYKLACQDPFPLQSICGSLWKNTEGQLSFLRYAVSAPPEVFSFSHSTRQLACLDAVQGLMLTSGISNHAWFCLDLLDVLCLLAERGYSGAVQSMLAYPVKHCPEVLLLGLAQVNTAYDLVQSEIIGTVFPILIGNTNRNSVIMQLWHINPSFVLRGILEALSNAPDNMARIVDICHETKILNHVLEMIPFAFAIRLAAASSYKDLLDLEKWLSDNIVTYRETFCEECLNYLKEVQLGTSPHDKNHHSGSMANVYAQTVSSFLKALQVNSRVLSSSSLSEEIDKLNVFFKHGILAQNDDISNKTTNISYGDDIELEANSYFQQMFSEQLSVSEMVEMLSRFKDSSDSREQSIFECVINNLFEESRFFPKYPERQLGIAAVLFGSVIKNQFVTHLTLGIAIRCVLDALRKPADSKMFAFGTKALEQFINRLDEWPQYCNHILQISHLRGTHPELVSYIEGVLSRRSHGGSATSVDQLNMSNAASNVNELAGSNGSHLGQTLSAPSQLQPRDHSAVDDINKPSANINTFSKSLLSSAGHSTTASSVDGVTTQKLHSAASTPAMLSSTPGFVRPSRGFGSALNIETLVAAAEKRETPIEAPSSEVQDKISFIVNNISTVNVESKAKELSDILEEQYYPWFAEYMVMKRASIEANFHEVYLKLVDKVNSKALNREVVQATYENCKVLLGSNLIKSSSEERSLLKNLGSWLGKLTIGRNQVLRARDIDPKSLIVEAYEKGLMIAVIPFTSKILEPCQSSLAYQPPNPWTMGILALLVEIYAMPNLKMNLKFDIEVLFKNLGVNMKDVAPTSLLKDRVRVLEGNPDFSNKDLAAAHAPTIPEDKPAVISALNQIELPLEVANTSHLGGHSHPMAPYGASSTLTEDDKHAAIVFSDQLPGAQGLVPSSVSQSPYNINQFSTLASIQQHAVINPRIGQMGLHPHFQRVIAHAIDKAVKEIVPGIVQRSVSIAIKTTKELVIKDYVMETDESRIYNAAHLMVGSLAGSLAHVTCKEPLRINMLDKLKNMLQGISVANDVLEAAIVMATNDNLDLGCANIENSAHEKALEMIDSEITQQISLRRTHRDSMGSSMYEASGFARGSMGIVPETLRPKPGRLSATQQRVYEDFGRLWQLQQTVPAANAAMTGSASSGNLNAVRQFSVSSGQPNPAVYSSGLPNSGLGSIAQPSDLPSEEIDSPSTQMLSASSNHHRVGDSIVQQRAEIEAVVVASSPAPDATLVDSSTAKDSVVPPATLPTVSTTEHTETAVSEPLLSAGDALNNYDMVAAKLEGLVAKGARETEVQAIISEVPQIILRCISRDEAALAVAQKVFKVLYENSANSLHVRAHLAILASIRDVCKFIVKELTSWVMHSESERKLNKDITVGLIRMELLNLAEYNSHMAKILDGGRNMVATEFAISLIQTLLNEEPRVVSELHSLVDVLAKLAGRPGSPESLQKLVEIARNPNATVGSLPSLMVGQDDNTEHARDGKVSSQSMVIRAELTHMDFVDTDNSGLNGQATSLFGEWFRICEHPSTDEATSSFILKLHHSGLLKGDDTSDRFFRILLELSVSHCLTSEGMSASAQQPMSFLAIDIYAKLVFSILKYCPVDQGSSKLFLLPKVLAVTVRFIQKDADEKKTSFNQRPYFRLFINWLTDLSSLDSAHDGVNFQVLTAFANAFHALQPLKVPAFSFAWLELVSHRTFMLKLLNGNSQKGWPQLHRLLIDLFQFMEPFLRNAELGDPIRLLYKGTLRVLLVLLHDFPQFLCDYHFSFCDVIPPSCIQMRNIVLSAFPRNMRLPDPSTPNLKIDLLVEMTHAPRILSEIEAALKAKLMKADVDEYLKTRQESNFLRELKQRLQLSPNDATRMGTRYNVPLINSLVLYVGVQAIQQLQARSPQPQAANNSILVDAALDIFHALILEFDTEGRYLFLNAIANQLRYPNNHTHYFSFILLYLFSETNQEIIQEQITRVLLERLIVNRPHPWGLLITFIELIKNPRYNFWNRSFTRCAPEIEKLFESVSRSCGGPKPVNEGITGALSDAVH